MLSKSDPRRAIWGTIFGTKNGPKNWSQKAASPFGFLLEANLEDHFWYCFLVPKIVPQTGPLDSRLETVFGTALGTKNGIQKCPPWAHC